MRFLGLVFRPFRVFGVVVDAFSSVFAGVSLVLRDGFLSSVLQVKELVFPGSVVVFLADYLGFLVVKSRFLLWSMCLAVLIFALSLFFSLLSVVEMVDFSIVYSLGFLRFAMAFAFVVFVPSFIVDLRDRKEFFLILSSSITRKGVVLSFVLTLLPLSFCVSVLSYGVFWLFSGFNYYEGSVVWFASFAIELAIISLASTLFALGLESSVTATMVSMVFYITSRLMGFFVSVVSGSFNPEGLNSVNSVIDMLFSFTSLLMPRLDLFCQTSWVVYPGSVAVADLLLFLAQGAIYIILLLVMLVIDFRKREF